MKKKESLKMKRREFLKASALAGAAAATVGLDGCSNALKQTADQKEKTYILPNVSTPNRPVIRNPEVCDGCNTCVDVCQEDVYVPNPEEGKPPITLHPDDVIISLAWRRVSCCNAPVKTKTLFSSCLLLPMGSNTI